MQNKMSSNIIMNENSCPRLRLDMSGIHTSVAHRVVLNSDNKNYCNYSGINYFAWRQQ